MRVVLDTNILVSAAGRRMRSARALYVAAASPPHCLILSNAILFEVYKVMAYPVVRARHRLSDAGIRRYIALLAASGTVISTTPLRIGPIIGADPTDDKVLLAAVAGGADVICSRDRHLFHPDVVKFAASHGIRILSETDLLAELRAP